MTLSFSTALNALKKGFRVYRKGWNGRGMWLKLQEPDCKSKMTLPYIYMKTADDQFVPWLASQTDLLSDDWQIHPEDIKAHADKLAEMESKNPRGGDWN